MGLPPDPDVEVPRTPRGLALPAAVALVVLCAAGAPIAALHAFELGALGRAATAEGALALREEAGRRAAGAVAEARARLTEAAEARAEARALRLSTGELGRSEQLEGGEVVAHLEWPSGRMLEAPEALRDPSVAVVWPELSALVRDDPAPRALRRDGWVWGIARREGVATVARVSIAASPAEAALDRARAALGSMAAPEPSPEPSLPGSVWALASGIFGLLLAAAWAHGRWSGPIRATLAAARAASHGEPGARAPIRGGREARETALAVNALIERAELAAERGRAARHKDVLELARLLEAFGRGDLAAPLPELSREWDSVRVAMEGARREIEARAGRLHAAAAEAARASAGVSEAARRLGALATEQHQGIAAMGGEVEALREELEGATEGLAVAVEGLSSHARAQRATALDVRATLATAGRRVADLRTAVTRIEGLATASEALDRALGLLGVLGRVETTAPEHPGQQRVSATVGAARASLDGLRRELSSLGRELGAASETLEELAQGQAEPTADLGTRVMGGLDQAAGLLAQIAERVGRGLRGVERSARQMASAAGEVEAGGLRAGRAIPSLAEALAELGPGTVEENLLERLTAMHRAFERAAEAGELTAEADRMLSEVAQAAEAARAKLAKLERATEATLAVLRG